MSKSLWHKQLIRGAIAFFVSIVLSGSVGSAIPRIEVVHSPNSQLHVSWHSSGSALATSGGRSSGGSFGSSGGGSSSSGSSSSGSSGSSSSGSSSSSWSSGSSSSSSYSSDSSTVVEMDPGTVLVIYVVLMACLIFTLVYQTYKAIARAVNGIKNKGSQSAAGSGLAQNGSLSRWSNQSTNEQTNDVVTVTQVQVALLASARHVQERFNEISTEYDWSTAKGLGLALKETTLTLLRSPEAWTHVSSSSTTIATRERAKQHFDRLSMEERRKFEMESLVNVGGKVKKRAIVTKEEGPAEYIVATLIVGSADDQPLFETLHTAEDLTNALEQLGSLPPNYLMVYEMLWSPQDASDSLTYEELLLNYPHMLQIC
ncbi:MAG: DUF1517 domain-containing protein [Cyanobacteria bacterium J06649_4]